MLELEPVYQQLVLLGAVVFALVFWVWGKWRYDVVAVLALLIISITGVIPFEETFVGFSHPAVIIVVAVLVISRGLLNSGAVDIITTKLPLDGKGKVFQVFSLTTLTALLSAFIYNIGALALLMPIAIRLARKSNISPGLFLMPMAFGAHLGGFLTLIGNAPNIIVSTFRTEAGLEPFGMFDFAYAGFWIVLGGLIFISFLGWRFIPNTKEPALKKEEPAEVQNYTTELLVTPKSKLVDKPLDDLYKMTKESFTVVALIRDDEKSLAPQITEIIRENDRLLVEASPEILQELVAVTKLEFNESKELDEKAQEQTVEEEDKEMKDVEGVVVPESSLLGQTAKDTLLRSGYNVNLLAVSRKGEQISEEIEDVRFQAGDVLLLRGHNEHLQNALSGLGLLPLAERELPVGQPRRVFAAVSIFMAAIGLSTAGIVPVDIAFALAAMAMIMTGLISLRQAYGSIEWPIVVLLGAVIPLGLASESSGAAQVISDSIVGFMELSFITPVVMLITLVVASITLSSLVNNVGVAVLMAPIAILLAQELGASPDPFLMAVAVGTSCSFMTPVGHQVNALIMRPGGYKFGDYWRMGLALNIIVLVISVPLILKFWPMF
ncbi:MAG: SLC13 family permease [Candidatus Spechtbacterales bacterium]